MAQKQEEGEKKPAKKAVEDELYDLEVPYKSRVCMGHGSGAGDGCGVLEKEGTRGCKRPRPTTLTLHCSLPPLLSQLRAEADEGIQGASLPFSTGIAEVALPEEDRKRAHEVRPRWGVGKDPFKHRCVPYSSTLTLSPPSFSPRQAALRAAQEAEERANKRPRRQNAPCVACLPRSAAVATGLPRS